MKLAKMNKRNAEEKLEKDKGLELAGDGQLVEDECGAVHDEVNDAYPYEGGDAANESMEADADSTAAEQNELATERDKYLRLAAEYDNYRKRSIKEREKVYIDARADTITKLLPVYDNLERALKTECTDEAFYKGVDMTMTQLAEIMENLGVAPIPAVGEAFDPNRHNAVMNIENPEYGEKIVVEEYQKGFIMGDKVIRFSTVVVAN